VRRKYQGTGNKEKQSKQRNLFHRVSLAILQLI
jgi:hypothetical protein